MSIEDEIFKNCKVDCSKLLHYGFIENNNNYMLEKLIYNNNFKVIINVTSFGKVSGKIFDLNTNEEFFNFRIINIEGSFSNAIKSEYIDLLTNIRNQCFDFSDTVNSWVVPANPKLFDVISHFENYDTITWKQPIDVHVHDFVYIYMGSPFSCILFKCEAIKVNFLENNVNSMEIKLLEKYDSDKYTLKKLQLYGLKGVRCPRKLPTNLSKILSKKGF